MRTTYTLVCLSLMLFCMSCGSNLPSFPEREIEGMIPVYADSGDYKILKTQSRQINRAGKIYVYGNVLLINEVNEGIHVIDNSAPSKPVNLFFIKIPGNTDMAIKDGLIYVNNHTDMAVLEITEDTFSEVSRIENLFIEENQKNYPRGRDIYFECVDESRGKVIGWRSAIIDSPECYKN